MAIEPIGIQVGVKPATLNNNQNETTQTTGAETPENIEKSNAARQMIGATALANRIAFEGKFDKLGKSVQKLLGDVNYTKIKSEKIGSRIIQENKDGKVIRQICSTDGKRIKFVTDYDPATGNVIKDTGFYENGKTIKNIVNRDPATGNRIKYTEFEPDGVTVKSITNYDSKVDKKAFKPINSKLKMVLDDLPADFTKIKGEKIGSRIIQENKDGKVIRQIRSTDGKRIKFVTDYDPVTGNVIKDTGFYENGKTIKNIVNRDPATGNRIKYTEFEADGVTVKSITNYDSKVDKKAFKPINSKLKMVLDDLPADFTKIKGEKIGSRIIQENKDGKVIRQIRSTDGKRIKFVTDYDPATGNVIKDTGFYENGKTIKNIVNRDPATGNRIKYTEFEADGVTVKSITNYDSKTGRIIE